MSAHSQSFANTYTDEPRLTGQTLAHLMDQDAADDLFDEPDDPATGFDLIMPATSPLAARVLRLTESSAWHQAEIDRRSAERERLMTKEAFDRGTLDIPPAPPVMSVEVVAAEEPDIDPGLAKVRRDSSAAEAARASRKAVRKARDAAARKLKHELKAHPELHKGSKVKRRVVRSVEDRGHKALS